MSYLTCTNIITLRWNFQFLFIWLRFWCTHKTVTKIIL